MQIAIIGLGKMGANMARRLSRGGHQLFLFDQDRALARQLSSELKATALEELLELPKKMVAPRHVWLMLPSGEITENSIRVLSGLLSPKDCLIDGANSFYKDSQRRAGEVTSKALDFVDVGVSGGIWGEKNGYALMIGGTAAAVKRLEPVFKSLAPAPDKGWLHCGPAGSGHFVKMVHNGIEYGMMQAFAEGLSLLENKKEFALDLGNVTEMWRHGSVVRSWLLDLIAEFLKDSEALGETAPFVADSGEGRWTVLESVEQGVPTPVITASLYSRFGSQGKDDYASRLLALMRKGFGGHATKKE